MNRAGNPSRLGELTRMSKKTVAIARFGEVISYSGAAGGYEGSSGGTAVQILDAKPGMCFVLDRIMLHGHPDDLSANESCVLTFQDADATVWGTMRWVMQNGSTATTRRATNREIRFNGNFCLPVAVGAVVVMSGGGVLIPEIHGFWITQEEAQSLGFATKAGTGHMFCKSVIPATTATTELIPAVAGKSIQIEGYCFNAAPSAATVTLTISHDDATTDRPIFKFYNGHFATPNYQADVHATGLEMNMPVGNSVNYTASTNAQNRCAFSVWGRYVKEPDTWNADGLPDLFGTATATAAAGTSTLTNTGKRWQTNMYAGKTVKIVAGTGVGASAVIASNTGTVLTITGTWTDAGATGGIDNTSNYEIVASTQGSKFWVCADAGTNATLTDTAFHLIPADKVATVSIRHVLVSGDANTATDLDPSAVRFVATYADRVGAAVSNDAGGGVGAPGYGLNLIQGAESDITSTAFAFFAGDAGARVSEADVCYAHYDVEYPVYISRQDNTIVSAEVSNGWTGVATTISGRFLDPAVRSTSTAAVASRYQP